jgi:hypothetical protein
MASAQVEQNTSGAVHDYGYVTASIELYETRYLGLKKKVGKSIL